LPVLDVRVMFGAVTDTAAASLNVAEELIVTKLLPVTPAPRETVVPAAVFEDSVTP
jgi:hypothetical protein